MGQYSFLGLSATWVVSPESESGAERRKSAPKKVCGEVQLTSDYYFHLKKMVFALDDFEGTALARIILTSSLLIPH